MIWNKKKHLLKWQNTLLTNPQRKLIMSEKQLLQQTTAVVNNELRIMNDCMWNLQTTVKPNVFFDRLELAESSLTRAAMFEPYISFTEKPSKALRLLYAEKNEIIADFLYRYLCEVVKKANEMKTDKGRQGKYQKFYDSLQPYYRLMDNSNIDYIETQYRAYTNK